MEQKSAQFWTIRNNLRHLVSYKLGIVTLDQKDKIESGVDIMELEELTALYEWVVSLEEYCKVL